MANIMQAIDVVLRQEDRTLSGVVTNRATDRGGRTRFGISERAHPEMTATGFFDAMSREAALTAAELVYRQAYAAPLRLGEIVSQAVATALLSMAIVCGVHEAVQELQRAVGTTQDGVLGPVTLTEVNSHAEEPLLCYYAACMDEYFTGIAEHDPVQEANLEGWKNRVAEVMNTDNLA